ncbi:hypothetical protein OH76DRAFT_475624 [Lentinus brumalis]|uniref:Uncharacterized protein n=1 Tax=Lentinus brumalis TaxID=2498619 RepID=A0A371CIB0_9APHY|nr:hypothetical protein OH76DRAFT_475624 [Polyporus brumalis]
MKARRGARQTCRRMVRPGVCKSVLVRLGSTTIRLRTCDKNSYCAGRASADGGERRESGMRPAGGEWRIAGACPWLTPLLLVMYSARTLRALFRAQSGRSTSELESEQRIGQPSGFVPVGEWPTAESSSEPASFRAAGRRAPDSDGEQFAFVLRCHVPRPQSATSEDQNWEGSQSPDRHVANVQLADQHAWLTPSCIRMLRLPDLRITGLQDDSTTRL